MDLDGGDNMPGLIGSLVLLIVGAITKYAYSDEVWTWNSGGEAHSLQVETVGNILLIAGLVALVLSVAYAFMARSGYVEEEEDVYEDPDDLPRRTVVTRDEDVLPLKKTRSRRKRTIE